MKNKQFIQIIALYLTTILSTSCSNSKASWMSNHKQHIDNKSVTQITLPGSRLANAYAIKNNNNLCQGELLPHSLSANAKLQKYWQTQESFDQATFVAYLNAQKDDINSQLHSGIRYLELQICKQNQQYYTSNLYLTASFATIAKQIKDFLAFHPDEIIFLDFEDNLWSENGYMNRQELNDFYNHLEQTFGPSIAPNTTINETIGQLKQQNYRLILLSSNPILIDYPKIWNRNQIAISLQAEYSTIKKISQIQTILNVESITDSSHLTILPIYSLITPSNPENTIIDSEDADWMLLSYLQQNINNYPIIIVTDHRNIEPLTDMITGSIHNPLD